MKSQYVFVIAIAVVVALYFIVRSLFGAVAPHPAQAKTAAPTSGPPSVQATMIPEIVRPYDVVVRGRTQATRTVIIRSETAGVVAAAPVLQGTYVKAGQVLCRVSVDARQAALDQARAALKSNQLTQQQNEELAKKGFRSPTQVLQGQANLDAASAAVRAAEIALAQVNIKAPFAGVFDHRDAEVGTYLGPGQPCGTMIEINPLLVVGDVPETQAASMKVGAPATARLVSGQTLRGHIRYVSHDADPQTRTYHLEMTLPNPKLDVRSGLSAEMHVGAGSGPAHLVPVSSLVLDAAGRQGVRYVVGDGRVAFAPVTVLEETKEGVWVTGLTGPVQLITVGQSYVADGQKVRVALVR
ncbi:efflux RND transporter periplasmic adaptor subunit [Phenylobacterium sp.]|uniref:efflux RND transporter periplasmic adaptor subunit n=1 Tax=Phenylobacterium sp. TaxID=1871053 RepID=UPI002C06D01E|nr:efflux RND transporter periplasmic adaptor subunit [Phenylobacterium sp.]HLZ77244.1 efflux RND transporter periplasmic adaptor subunit [Phenylobacterium sp.]